ncbi:hypothetical protein [Wolbachia endosymbiont of Cardiocondyla obscurior]|uniref:hypothetical protein n=1 Tax=Wolbachia endosymbiont of Cardiocondyla obscurior TaxID=2687307 RepID=UPI00157B0A07|nr:hypothetical protein [Wolbachia endosymbiont of Cardiocondyla obscurior]
MSILRRLLGINSNTPEIKEAIGFNPTNVELIEGNGVAYGLSYQDNGNGSSKVKLLIIVLPKVNDKGIISYLSYNGV